jgi:hypothetical protein
MEAGDERDLIWTHITCTDRGSIEKVLPRDFDREFMTTRFSRCDDNSSTVILRGFDGHE